MRNMKAWCDAVDTFESLLLHLSSYLFLESNLPGTGRPVSTEPSVHRVTVTLDVNLGDNLPDKLHYLLVFVHGRASLTIRRASS